MEQAKKGRKPICCTKASNSLALVTCGCGMAGNLPTGGIFLSIAQIVGQVEGDVRVGGDLPLEL
jgi:hypothetical protein